MTTKYESTKPKPRKPSSRPSFRRDPSGLAAFSLTVPVATFEDLGHFVLPRWSTWPADNGSDSSRHRYARLSEQRDLASRLLVKRGNC